MNLISQAWMAAGAGRVPIRVQGPVVAGDVLVPSGKNDGMASVLRKLVGTWVVL